MSAAEWALACLQGASISLTAWLAFKVGKLSGRQDEMEVWRQEASEHWLNAQNGRKDDDEPRSPWETGQP